MRTPHRLLLFLLITTTAILFAHAYRTTFVITENPEEQANVTRVIDGDTLEILLSNKTEKVRLLDVNTPEKSQPYHPEAVKFTGRLEGKTVILVRGKEDRDKYGRLLRYVFLDKEFINEIILAEGLANFYSYQDSQYTSRLKKAQEDAIKNQKGIWERSENKCAECLMLKDIENGEGKDDCQPGVEYIRLKNECGFSCDLDGWTLKDDANHIYKFSNPIESQSTLTLYSGKGEDNQDENIFYYQNTAKCASVWNDDGDSLFLRDDAGRLVIYENY